jgi:arginyl-tRNA--protein-N-Asp/Glu arginylyltransferase
LNQPRVFDKTSILLVRSHDDKGEEGECSYCNEKRCVDDPETGEKGIEETGVKYHKFGFTTTKMRVDDLETCLNNGFTRCGTYVYKRNSKNSCCEVWQYRVNCLDFKMSKS